MLIINLLITFAKSLNEFHNTTINISEVITNIETKIKCLNNTCQASFIRLKKLPVVTIIC